MTKMNPEVKARWVAALRSGEYKQGSGELRTDGNQFCCLGVLCDLHDKDGWFRSEKGDSFTYEHDGAEDFELPPKSLRPEWGFDWDDARVWIGNKFDTLYNHNDAGRTFAEIADAIESQL